MIAFDTNCIIRYLLNDIPSQADQVERLLSQNQIFIMNEVLVECVYVLRKVYGIEKATISETLISFLNLSNIESIKLLLIKALELYEKTNLDIVDCILISVHQSQNLEIKTFDKKLLQHLKNVSN